jgi:hypothetical protein
MDTGGNQVSAPSLTGMGAGFWGLSGKSSDGLQKPAFVNLQTVYKYHCHTPKKYAPPCRKIWDLKKEAQCTILLFFYRTNIL